MHRRSSGYIGVEGLRCSVLGGSGFLGNHLSGELHRRGASVVCYGRTAPSLPDGIAHLQGDFSTHDAILAKAIEGSDVVYHLVTTSTPATAEANRLEDVEQNVCAAIRLLDLCVERGIPRVVFASSGGTVYGSALQPPFSERTLPQPISSYGISKLTIEHYLRLYNHAYGMRNISLRISNPFGPFQTGARNQGAIGTFARKMLSGDNIDIWGDGEVIRDYVYVSDVIDAFVRVARYSGSADVLNIGSGRGRSIKDVIASLEAVVGKPAKVTYHPRRTFDVAASVLDCDLARQELGWEATTSWTAGLVSTIEWMRTLHSNSH